VLVTTAITPYFTPQQHERVKQSLLDVKKFFAATPALGNVPLQVEWRVTKGLQDEIGVSTVLTDLSGRELAAVLQNVDAVISTPSTAMVEAMLLGLPVAVLDYCNCPHYVQPAWRITAAEHLHPVVTELVTPPAPKMLFQETILHDTLECTTTAAPRLRTLASEMMRRGQEARGANVPLSFPSRLISLSGASPAEVENRFEPAALYPSHAPFLERNIHLLQVEVGQLRAFSGQSGGGTVDSAERQKVKSQAQLTVQWRSKVEAAVILLGLKQLKPAMDLLMQSLKVVENCREPEVTMEALFEISGQMGRLDPARARVLLEIALKLAQQMQRPEAAQRAKHALAKLPLNSPKQAA
jgi:hypothetical protein